MKMIRVFVWLSVLSAVAFFVPYAAADSHIIGTAVGGGTIPAGQYAGQTFTSAIAGEYSGYAAGTLIIGHARIVIGTEVFTSVETNTFYSSFCCGNGGVALTGFYVHGLVLHETSDIPHCHLFAASAATDGSMCINIENQTATAIPEPILACDPGVGLLCNIPAVVHIGPAVLTVSVDIKPGSFPNPINVGSKGVIPVAILSTVAFDATTVDALTVKFGPAGATETHGKGHIEDANGDGKPDLVLHFRTEESGIKAGDVSASLTGKTFGGQEIQGSDAIVTVGGGSKKELAKEPVLEQSLEGTESRTVSLRAYPNPFNPSTIVAYSLPKEDFVSLKVYNSVGVEVAVLVNDVRSAGIHNVRFDATQLAGGIYFVRLMSGGVIHTEKLVLLK